MSYYHEDMTHFSVVFTYCITVSDYFIGMMNLNAVQEIIAYTNNITATDLYPIVQPGNSLGKSAYLHLTFNAMKQ